MPSKTRNDPPEGETLGARQRRDIVSGEVTDEGRLIRFVAAPDGAVAPDLARKLPGRGLWVASDRASLAAAVKKNAFARAAKAPLKPAADLPDRVEAMLVERLLSGLGLARRSGQLLLGFEKVAAAAEQGRASVIIQASDAAADGRRKMGQAIRRAAKAPLTCAFFTSGELGLALGGENVIHTAFLAGRAADRWAEDAHRLSGFRPLLPEGWREEP